MKKLFGLLSLLFSIYTVQAQDITLPSTNFENEYQSSLTTGLVSPSIPLFSLETASPDLTLDAKLVFNSVLLEKNGTIAEGAKSFFPNGWEVNIIPSINKMIIDRFAAAPFSPLEDEIYFTNPMGNNPTERPERVPNLYSFNAFDIHGKFYFEEINNQMVIKVIQASEYVDIKADFTYTPSSANNAEFKVHSFTITDSRGTSYEFSVLQTAKFVRESRVNPNNPLPTDDFYGGILIEDYTKSFLLTKVTDRFNTTLLEYNYGGYEEVVEHGLDEYTYDQKYLQSILVNGIGEVHLTFNTSSKKYRDIYILDSFSYDVAQFVDFNTLSAYGGDIIFKTDPSEPAIQKKYNVTKSGTTLTITQPTGGKTKYEFEPNDYGFLQMTNNLVIPEDFAFENTVDEEVPVTKTVYDELDLFTFSISDQELLDTDIYLKFSARDPFYNPELGFPYMPPPIFLYLSNGAQTLHSFPQVSTESEISATLNEYKNQFPNNVFTIGGPSINSYSGVEVLKRTTFTDTADIKKEEWNGLRIKNIQQLDENNQIVAEKQFIYTMPDEPNRSSGQILFELKLNRHNSKPVPPYSQIPQTYFYKYVTVKEEGKGKTVYSFDDSPKGVTRFYYTFHSLSYVPILEMKYDENNILLERKETSLQYQELDIPDDMKPEAEPILESLETEGEIYKRSSPISPAKILSTTTEATFDPVTRFMVNQKISDEQLNETIEVQHEYQKLGTSYFETAVKKYHDGTMINQSEAEYMVANSLSQDPNAYALQKSLVAKGTLPFEEDKEITQYDTKGHVLEYKTKEGLYVSQIWGYNDTKVVAELQNMRYDDIAAATITNIKNNSNSSGYNETNLITALNSLRTAHPDAFITTYTFIPMVGVKTTTDANGRTETREYDNFNRLHKIIDHEGNVVKEYKYNIKN